MKAYVTLVVPILLVMRSQTSERRDDHSPHLLVSCAEVAGEKRPRTVIHMVPLSNKIDVTSLVCWFVRFVPTRDRGPGGRSSEDFPSLARRAFFFNAIVCSLSHREVPSHRSSAFPSISPELTRNANRKVEPASQ